MSLHQGTPSFVTKDYGRVILGSTVFGWSGWLSVFVFYWEKTVFGWFGWSTFSTSSAWLKRLKTMGNVRRLVSKHQFSCFASSFLCINCSSVPVVTMKLSTNNYGALLNDHFQNLDMREVSRLLQSQTWPKHVAKYSDSSTDSQCSRTNSSNSSWETTEATGRLFAIFLNLAEDVGEVWKWLCPVTTVCQPKTIEKIYFPLLF